MNDVASTQPETTLAKYLNASQSRDRHGFLATLAPTFIEHNHHGMQSLAEARAFWQVLESGFCLELELQDSILEQDRAAVRWIERGKAVGPFQSKKASQMPFEQPLIETLRFEDGLIAERWVIRDMNFFASQAGWSP
jgi:hypothetical protein